MTELIKKAILKFTPSDSPDIAGYNLYVVDADLGPVSRQNPAAIKIDLGKPALNEDGQIDFDLTSLPELSDKEGIYSFGLSSYDTVGNESALLTAGLEGINLDFNAPNPPTNATISFV